MKTLLLFFVVICSLNSNAQKTIKTLINTETTFATYAIENGMQPAFIKYLDSNSIAFINGNPINNFNYWSKVKSGPGILSWHPHFAEIAVSGDLGYTLGPWTYQPKTINDSIIDRGGFNSVWRLNNKGEWKNIIDLGVDNMPESKLNIETKIISPDKHYSPTSVSEIIDIEKAFINAFIKNSAEAYCQYLSKNSILSRNNHLPATEKNAQQLLIKEIPNLTLTIQGSGISEGGDLGYVYGSSLFGGKMNNYLHIWRKEKSGWKLALDVLKF